jgi:hypothetical protein
LLEAFKKSHFLNRSPQYVMAVSEQADWLSDTINQLDHNVMGQTA